MSWTFQQKSDFRDALLDRYRDEMKLTMFLADKLDVQLNRLAARGPLDDMCFQAIDTLDSEDRLDELYLAFRAANPNKPFSRRTDLPPQDGDSQGDEPDSGSNAMIVPSSEVSHADYERVFTELQTLLKRLQEQYPNVRSESEALDIIDAEVTSESAPQHERLVNLRHQLFNLERHFQAIKATTAEVAKHYLEESVWAKAGITYLETLSETPDRGA